VDHFSGGTSSFKNFLVGSFGAFLVIVIALATQLPLLALTVFFGWLGYAIFTSLSRLNPRIGRSPNMRQLSVACTKFYEVETREVDVLVAEQLDSWLSQYEAGLIATRLMRNLAESHFDESEAVLNLLEVVESGSRKKRLSLV
jgi:hypothetical protein